MTMHTIELAEGKAMNRDKPSKATKEAASIKAALLKQKAPEPKALYLSTGSTLLNLATSSRVNGGLLAGHTYLFCGDSMSGKTLLAHYCLAEASIDPRFDKYRLIFDGPEDGALFDITKFFGARLNKRLEPPRKDKKGNRIDSCSVDDFYWHVHDAVEVGKPFVYVLDSMDALHESGELAKFVKGKNVARKKEGKREAGEDEGTVKDVAGSYGTAKAKKNSTNLNWVNSFMSRTGSILVIIAQSRTTIGFGAMFNPKTRGGGVAMRFYATGEIWTSVKSQIHKNVKGGEHADKAEPRNQGIVSHVQVKKNRQTGQVPAVDLNVYSSHGLDDTGSNVAWLCKEGHWRSKRDKVGNVVSLEAPEFGYEGKPEGLAVKVEAEGKEGKLKNIVAATWWEIEAACAIQRKNRYA
jgi:RecA/RadA recombinase